MSNYLKNLNRRIDRVAQEVVKEIPRIEVQALTAGYIPMMNRIFGTGTDGGGAAKDGTPFGEYSDRWRNIRMGLAKFKGKKKVYGLNFQKNLVFERNLRNSIQLGFKDGKPCVGYTDLELKKIAEYQEESSIQINKPIFGFDATEGEARDIVLNREIPKVIDQAFSRI